MLRSVRKTPSGAFSRCSAICLWAGGVFFLSPEPRRKARKGEQGLIRINRNRTFRRDAGKRPRQTGKEATRCVSTVAGPGCDTPPHLPSPLPGASASTRNRRQAPPARLTRKVPAPPAAPAVLDPSSRNQQHGTVIHNRPAPAGPGTRSRSAPDKSHPAGALRLSGNITSTTAHESR